MDSAYKLGSTEEAQAVAKEAVWLAWNACGGAQGMGVFQNNPGADKDAVWDQAYNMGDYSGRQSMRPSEVCCDYVFGRMMKLYFSVQGDTLYIQDSKPRGDYQSWCHKYPTFRALFDAAAESVRGKTQAAA